MQISTKTSRKQICRPLQFCWAVVGYLQMFSVLFSGADLQQVVQCERAAGQQQSNGVLNGICVLGWALSQPPQPLSLTLGAFTLGTEDISSHASSTGKQWSGTSASNRSQCSVWSSGSLQGFLKRKYLIWQELAMRSFHLKQIDFYPEWPVYFWCFSLSSCNSTP